MRDRYYLCSKDIGDGPYLLGELTRDGDREYSFRYMIKGSKFPEWFMSIPGMENVDEVYGTEKVLDCIIHRVTPREGTTNAGILMRYNNVPVYDEWDLLESQMAAYDRCKKTKFPLSDSHELFYFYSEIPRKVNRYD